MPDASAPSLREVGVRTAGQVAELLGVSPVTLRSWNTRYGIGPTAHEPGMHRRYSETDVEQLQAMCALVSSGVPTREAAELAAHGYHPELVEDVTPADVSEQLIASAERLSSGALAELADSSLAEHGVITAWQEIFAPALRRMGRRWARYGDRVEVESATSDAVDAALERQMRLHPVPAAAADAVLLSCCPGERHALPLKALRLALRERGIGAVLLGTGVPAEATVAAAERLDPSVTVLWSLARETADPSLLRGVAGAAGVAGVAAAQCLAGPGWSPGMRKRSRHTNSLDHATDLVAALVEDG